MLAVLAVLLAACVPLAATAQAARSVADGRPLLLTAEAVLLLDFEGRTIFAKNPEEERAPASLVKLMTLYLAFEDIEAGRADLDELVPVSRYASLTPRARMGLRAGEMVPLHVLLEGVAIASANDAATALAERLAGDEWSFVGRMNAKAQELELHATRFANPHGLPDPAQRSNARDLAQLIARLLKDHPASRPMLGGQTFVYRGRVYARHIPLFNDPLGVQALKNDWDGRGRLSPLTLRGVFAEATQDTPAVEHTAVVGGDGDGIGDALEESGVERDDAVAELEPQVGRARGESAALLVVEKIASNGVVEELLQIGNFGVDDLACDDRDGGVPRERACVEGGEEG